MDQEWDQHARPSKVVISDLFRFDIFSRGPILPSNDRLGICRTRLSGLFIIKIEKMIDAWVRTSMVVCRVYTDTEGKYKPRGIL